MPLRWNAKEVPAIVPRVAKALEAEKE